MSSGNENGGGGGGPCGACKFLRRKCVKGCIFAPYFDPDQGTAHFAAVHKVFGASNASKLLLRIPPHKRLDAVLTLCYEALARVRDPVYGCVAHIFTLQQQVVNLQAELAYVQAQLSTLQCLPLPPPQPPSPPPANIQSSSDMGSATYSASLHFDHPSLSQHGSTDQMASLCSPLNQELEDGDLHALAREFVVSRYLKEVRVQPSGSR